MVVNMNAKRTSTDGFPLKILHFISRTTQWNFIYNIRAAKREHRQCGFRPGVTQTELYKHIRLPEAGHFGFRKWRN